MRPSRGSLRLGFRIAALEKVERASWYELTAGRAWLELGETTRLEVPDTAWSFVELFWCDWVELLPRALESVPEEIAALARDPARMRRLAVAASVRMMALAFAEPQASELEALYRWWNERCWMPEVGRDGSSASCVRSRAGIELRWGADPTARLLLEPEELHAAVQAFDREFLAAMRERIRTRPDLALHHERQEQFLQRELEASRTTDWDAVRRALDRWLPELEPDGPA